MPSNFPQANEHSPVAYQYQNFSDGQLGLDRVLGQRPEPEWQGRVHLPRRSDHVGADAWPDPTDPRLYGTSDKPNLVEKVTAKVKDVTNN